MTAFGGYGRFGADPVEAEETPAAQASPTPALQALSPVIASTIAELQNPYRRVEVLQARLANAKARGAAPARIRVLEAQLRAAQQGVDRAEAGAQSTREWSTLGKTGVTIAIVGGIGLTLLLVSAAFALQRRGTA